MKKLLIIAGLITTIIVLIGCAKPVKDVSKLGPEQLVKTYYQSLAVGDITTARECLSDEYAKEIGIFEDSDLTNLRSIKDIRVRTGAPVGLYGKNYKEAQVVAQYEATYRQMITEADGKQIRFIYVAKKTKNSPWKIISIGTGP